VVYGGLVQGRLACKRKKPSPRATGGIIKKKINNGTTNKYDHPSPRATGINTIDKHLVVGILLKPSGTESWPIKYRVEGSV
jgi:hypothetical protein